MGQASQCPGRAIENRSSGEVVAHNPRGSKSPSTLKCDFAISYVERKQHIFVKLILALCASFTVNQDFKFSFMRGTRQVERSAVHCVNNNFRGTRAEEE